MKILKTIAMFAIIANLATDISASAAAVVAELLDSKNAATSSVAVKPLNTIRHLDHILIPDELLGPIKSYVDGLPQIAKCGGDNPQSKIVLFLQGMSPPSKSDVTGQGELATRIEVMMATKQPIPMVIPGFPCKSTNKEHKVLGGDIDLGEFVGLITLNHICGEIGTIYPPGARISIIPDGAAYLDLLGINPMEYEQYQSSLARLIGTFFSETISLEQEMVPSILKIIDKLEEPKVDAETEADMARFFGTEFPKKLKSEIVEITHAVAVCSAKFGKGIAELLQGQDYLRLSVHPHSNIAEKCGISLAYNVRGTPWHNAPVLCNGLLLETGVKGIAKIKVKGMFPIGDACGDKGGITLMKLMDLDLARQQKKSKSGFDITPRFVRAESVIAGISLSYMLLNFAIVKTSSGSNYKPLWG
ncbi:MAG: L-tyrosine/L-tryptophan isonitrile synthase family protein [Proteobacteria bacterium]|nr:L-tyrosine/L-tryptophan isonitrile synthase family protein [Pseudomonadota bacterium]